MKDLSYPAAMAARPVHGYDAHGPGRTRKTDGLSEHSLAPYGNRIARPPVESRRDALNRAISWGLVAVVHLIFLTMLTISFIQQERIGHRKRAIETILDLSLLHNPNAPPVTLVEPTVRDNAPPEITTAPITITPVKPDTRTAARRRRRRRYSQGGGRGAGLRRVKFRISHRCPARALPPSALAARELPNGDIVMDLPPKPLAQEPQIHMSGADQMRHDMQTAPGCPP